MTTLHLIREWSMEGASRDAQGRFRSADELRAAFSPTRLRPEPSASLEDALVDDVLLVARDGEAHIPGVHVRRHRDRP
jgi:hypothetical protein